MTSEREARALSGWIMLPVTVALYAAAVALIIAQVTAGWDVLLIAALFLLGRRCAPVATSPCSPTRRAC